MLKDFTWGFFEKTGSIEAFLEYSQMKDVSTGEINEDKPTGTDN